VQISGCLKDYHLSKHGRLKDYHLSKHGHPSLEMVVSDDGKTSNLYP
jgi:hypothetical protein